MKTYLLKPKETTINIKGAENLLYSIDQTGHVHLANEPLSEARYYIYAPYPLNILISPYAVKYNMQILGASSLNYLKLSFIKFWLKLEQALYGSDVSSKFMRNLLIKNFKDQKTDMFFISNENWLKHIDIARNLCKKTKL